MMLPAAFLGAPIAHRAYHDKAQGRPENSLAAIRAAVAAGYGIEIDVQPSSDGTAMVFHDDVLERLTDQTGPISDRTATELGKMSLLGTAETIPTLAQVLKEVSGKVPLLIEIKDQSHILGPVDGALERTVAQELEGYEGSVALMSFNPHSVAALAKAAPEVPRGITTCGYGEDWWNKLPQEQLARLKTIPDYGPTGSSFVSHEYGALDMARIAELKGQGAAILCWTVKSPEAEAEARRVADNVTFEGYAAAIPS